MTDRQAPPPGFRGVPSFYDVFRVTLYLIESGWEIRYPNGTLVEIGPHLSAPIRRNRSATSGQSSGKSVKGNL